MRIIMQNPITDICARQIIDSRGIPTVEASVILSNGSIGTASVPSGASKGQFEAMELRDNQSSFDGKSVYTSIQTITNEIKPLLLDNQPKSLFETDTLLCKLDGTKFKSKLGANAVLAISVAFAKAKADSYALPLYQYIGGIAARLLPLPMMNIINGGKHADNNLDIQEFMIIPHGALSFSHALQMGCETYYALKRIIKARGFSISIGDEGGFAPNLDSHEHALDLITDAVIAAGYRPEEDISIALDIAASEWQCDDGYRMPKQNRLYTVEELTSYYQKLLLNYPILSIEDPFGEEDFAAFTAFRKCHPERQIVGDDLFVTNPDRIRKGISLSAGNAALIKPNQIGTLSETMQAVSLATEGGFNTIISHRSGDTCDSMIADLSVALNAGQIKTGAPCRGERIAKYNRLLAIEEELGSSACYGCFN